ncbi:MAG: hypothetical protein AAGJ46_06580 [Planctomycetota bacterium]
MLLDAPSVPDAPSVDHNAIEAAKPLLILGWPNVACLAARAAVESRVVSEIERRRLWHRAPERAKFHQLARVLERHRVFDHSLKSQLVLLHAYLSRVGHGDAVPLSEAASLIEQADQALKEEV